MEYFCIISQIGMVLQISELPLWMLMEEQHEGELMQNVSRKTGRVGIGCLIGNNLSY
jgi:hypothetical protein